MSHLEKIMLVCAVALCLLVGLIYKENSSKKNVKVRVVLYSNNSEAPNFIYPMECSVSDGNNSYRAKGCALDFVYKQK